MKLKDFLKQFEGLDLESEVDESGNPIEVPLNESELNSLIDTAFNDGYFKYKNLNPYPEDSLRWCEYNYNNDLGMVAADR